MSARAPIAAGANAWLIACGILALGLVLLAHGLLPGYINDQSTAYLTEGAIRCEHALGLHALTTHCHAYGNPLGYPLLTNVPVIMFGALVMWVPGIGSAAAFVLAQAAVDALALVAGYALGRRLGARKSVALWAAGLYLISPTVIGLRAFPGTFSGYALLPLYALADLFLLDEVARGRSRRLAAVLVGYAALRTGALFMDGYSFVISGLVSACLFAAWAWRRRRGRHALLAAASMLLANALAYTLYSMNMPGPFPSNPLGVLRSMGLDTVTLLAPTSYEWLAHLTGVSWSPVGLWGDNTNAAYNYIGFTCVALALWGARGRYAAALAAAGLIALGLSLGPALKVDSRNATPAGRPTTVTPYVMPSSQAVAEFPWDQLFENVPGVKAMRATYRWFGATRLALVMLAALGIERLARRRERRWRVIAVIAATIATLELLPNFPFLLGTYRANARQMNQATQVLGGELRSLTRPGQRVFFLNHDGTHNDFVVNYLAPDAQIRAYNAGGDKDALFAMQTWPADIVALAGRQVTANAVYAALRQGNLDVVIVPHFHLRWAAYMWPPAAQDQTLSRQAFARLLHDPRLRVRRSIWLTAITLSR